MNLEQARVRVGQTQIDLDDIKRQGGHRPNCAAQAGEVNFDYSCNLCKVIKNHVQACADLTAAEVYDKCSILAGESAIS